jgi:hypothetical protein
MTEVATVAGGQRTITIKFDGSAKGLIAEAGLASKAISGIGSNATGLKHAGAEADVLSRKLTQTAKDSKETGSLLGGSIALGLSAAAPLVGAALTGGVALGFVGVAAEVQKNNRDVVSSFSGLKNQVVTEMTSATNQVVPALVKSGHALQQEFADLGPELHTAFSFAGPDIKTLTSGVDNLADNAMPGLVASMRNSKPIVQGVSTVLGDLGTTASVVLTSVADHSHEFGDDLDQIGSLIKNVGSITAGVLPGLASGFGTTVGTANTLLSVLKPVAPVLGNITGEVLPAVGAFKLLGLATSPLNKLGGKVAGVASNVGGLTQKLTGNEAAATRVTSATTKVGSALGKLGNALPLVGAGYALADAGAQKLFGSQDQLANSLLNQTGPALQSTAVQLAKNDGITQGLHQTLGGLGDFLSSQFIPTTKDVESGLTGVQKAQVTYNEAVANFGPKSAQAAQAQRDLATANAADQRSQQKLATALLTTNERLFTQETNLLSLVNANLGLQSSALGVQAAQQTYAAALKNSGAKSVDAKTAFLGLEQAQSDEANAAITAAGAAHNGASANVVAKAETLAYTGSVLGMAAASNGHLTPALATMVGHLDATSVAAFAATGKISGTRQEVVKLPGGKTIKINVNSNGQAVAAATQRAINGVKSRTVSLLVNENIVLGKTPSAGVTGIGGLLGLPHRALGGPAPAGRAFIVGDGGGPEIFVPHQNGSIIGTRESASILGSDSGGDVSGDVQIVIDGQVIASIAKAEIMAANKTLVARVKAGSRIR